MLWFRLQSTRKLPDGRRLGVRALLIILLLASLFPAGPQSRAQFRSTYTDQGQYRAGSRAPTAGRPIQLGQSTVYPEFRSQYGVIRWVPQQMPLKVYVSRGLTLDSVLDEEQGVPANNVSNINKWPDLVAEVISNPETFNDLGQAEGYNDTHYQACLEGISMWKNFEPEQLFAFIFVDDPTVADIHVFWVHHFVDKMGLALFQTDIRGYTAKRSFPYKAVMSGAQADFKPVLIQLRTTEANGVPMPYQKMRAAAAHEFGHALGIEGHSTNPNDLMSLYYGHGQLSASDKTTIRYLYRLTPDLIP